jgi:hypothetical protein
MVTVRQGIIALLEAQLNPAVLLLGDDVAPFDVVDYTSPACFLKTYLENRKVQVLFTVKRANGLTSRFLQQIPHTDKTDFEVAVWCLSKAPQLNTDYMNLRDAAVLEVQRIFKAYPASGSEKSVRDDDHAKGNVQIYNSTVTVTHKTFT